MAKRPFQVTISSPPKSSQKTVHATNVAAAAREAVRLSAKAGLDEDAALTIIVTPS